MQRYYTEENREGGQSLPLCVIDGEKACETSTVQWEKVGTALHRKAVLHGAANLLVESEWVICLGQEPDWRVQSHSNVSRKVSKGQVVHPSLSPAAEPHSQHFLPNALE